MKKIVLILSLSLISITTYAGNNSLLKCGYGDGTFELIQEKSGVRAILFDKYAVQVKSIGDLACYGGLEPIDFCIQAGGNKFWLTTTPFGHSFTSSMDSKEAQLIGLQPLSQCNFAKLKD
ncbi:MAG: hypothetical protein HOO06_09175 [Bdellovibrionaceae bacterium]|nr:hypothetical protein [Pseudobdellovibrionaceae bacterium]